MNHGEGCSSDATLLIDDNPAVLPCCLRIGEDGHDVTPNCSRSKA
jgi:hypothetical protein